MHGPKDRSNERIDKSFHGLAVGLGLAVTVAAVVIVFAYAATDGFSKPMPAAESVPAAEPTSAAVQETGMPTVSDTKQELKLVQDKVQEEAKIADNIAKQLQPAVVQNSTDKASPVEEPAYTNVEFVSPVQVEVKSSNSIPAVSSNGTAQNSNGTDQATPASNPETPPPLTPPPVSSPPITTPIADGDKPVQTDNKGSHHDGDSKHHQNNVDVKEPKSDKHSISFKITKNEEKEG